MYTIFLKFSALFKINEKISFYLKILINVEFLTVKSLQVSVGNIELE